MTRTNYPTDLTNAQWEKPITLSAKTFTIRQTSQVGDALNYQRYVLHSQVRVSMANVPPWQTVYPISESGKP